MLSFVEKTLVGEGAKDTAVTRLREDLLDPSFRIPGTDDVYQVLEEFNKIKQDSMEAEKRYMSKKNQRSSPRTTDGLNGENLNCCWRWRPHYVVYSSS